MRDNDNIDSSLQFDEAERLEAGQAPEDNQNNNIEAEEQEEEEKDELEELLFFRHLEENNGKIGHRTALMGCASILPMLAVIVLAIFFLLRFLYQ